MLEAKDLHKTYRLAANELHVLRGINVAIEEGDVAAIVGPSGAGKSTLLHILGALDKPSSGKVTLEGEEIYSLSENQRARMRNTRMGFIFQFYHLLPEFTALENVILPAVVKANVGNDSSVRTKALELLDRVGLANRSSHKPNELSGGEQQRGAIARALVNDPKVIFCDEPTGNLDSESGRQIIQLLLELNKKNKQTLVIVTHDDNIAKVARTVIRMRDGKLV